MLSGDGSHQQIQEGCGQVYRYNGFCPREGGGCGLEWQWMVCLVCCWSFINCMSCVAERLLLCMTVGFSYRISGNIGGELNLAV